MNLIIRINLDNDAFQDDLEAELENCMEQIQWHFEKHVHRNFNLTDSNGDTVGTVVVTE